MAAQDTSKPLLTKANDPIVAEERTKREAQQIIELRGRIEAAKQKLSGD